MSNPKLEWEKYVEEEVKALSPILHKYGFSLEKNQPHTKGERYLMNAVTTKSGRKLILLGSNKKGERVVIKGTRDKGGTTEIEHERNSREVLGRINFAYHIFYSPEEILFSKEDGFTIYIQKFIEQDKAFLERSLGEQFDIALTSFKAQESAHATTFTHKKLAQNNFSSFDSRCYLENFRSFKENINREYRDENLQELLSKGEKFIEENNETIEQYSSFLTHTDFVPHNFRVANNKVYLLDSSSLRFGNKYEGWARFINFMVLYNKPLEEALVKYVELNRTKEEFLSLTLMRIYRLGEIIWYYVRTLENSSGDLLILNKKRIEFWITIFESILNNKPIENKLIEDYISSRDSLRSEEEKQRQIGLH